MTPSANPSLYSPNEQQASNRLELYSDQQLKDELKRREDERRIKEEEDRKKREVTVVCPRCNGTLRVHSGFGPIQIGVGEAPEFVDCTLCNRTGRIKALRAE